MTTATPHPAIEGVPVDWEHRRELFTLDPRVAHLNHGSYGAAPLPVQRAQQRLRDEMEANPMAFFSRGLLDRITHTRRHLAASVRADPDGTALVPNATAAANAVLRSVPLRAGQEILLTDHGYGAVQFTAQDVADRIGVTLRTVPIPLLADDDEVVDRVVSGVRPGHTRLAVIDHIASPTAKLFPVDRVVAELRRRDVLVLVDAAHGPGMLPVDVAATDADFWHGNLHKWTYTPRPTALLNVAAAHRPAMRPLVVSWEQQQGFPFAQEFAGTLDYTGWLAAPTGVHLLRSLGPDRVQAHNNQLVAQGQRVVAAAVASRWPVAAAGERSEWLELARAGRLGSDAVSMRLVPLPPGRADDIDTLLALRGRLAAEYSVEVAVNAWGGVGLLRVSGQVYNRPEDYERLADALRVVL